MHASPAHSLCCRFGQSRRTATILQKNWSETLQPFRPLDDATCGNAVTADGHCDYSLRVRRASTSDRLHNHHPLDAELVGNSTEALCKECLPDWHCDFAVLCESIEDTIGLCFAG
jgi:hypothetical protein